MEAKGKRLYSGITLGAVLIMAFVLVQPTMNQAGAVGIEGLPEYDDCSFGNGFGPVDDRISMNTVRSGNIVKTIHAEKEFFACRLDQGDLTVVVDVTTYIEIYENIITKEIIKASAVVATCLKDVDTATVIGCESYVPSSSPVPVGSECSEVEREILRFTHPQEMNTVNKGSIAKTIESQKEIFECFLGAVIKKVDVILFTEIFEDLSTQTVTDVQFHSMRCVVLLRDGSDERRDGIVETCQFSTIEN